MEYSTILAKQFDIKEEYAANIIALLDDGNTIPFIARYRKEMHGSMDDQLIRAFSEKLEYLRSLDKRRGEIRALIEVQEKLSPEVSASLDKAQTLSELEDIYRPFRPKRKTRASVAKERGLEPLALALLKQEKGFSPSRFAAGFVNEEKGVNSSDEALQGAKDIIAEQVSDSPEIRKRLRTIAQKEAEITSDLKPGTKPLPLIVAFSKALRLVLKDMDKKEQEIIKHRDRVIEHLSKYPNVMINSSKYCIPHILNISLMNIKPETFIHALEKDEIYVSSNTACSSGKPSTSVDAMYHDDRRSTTTIRISFSHLTLPSEISEFLASFDKHYEELSKLN